MHNKQCEFCASLSIATWKVAQNAFYREVLGVCMLKSIQKYFFYRLCNNSAYFFNRSSEMLHHSLAVNKPKLEWNGFVFSHMYSRYGFHSFSLKTRITAIYFDLNLKQSSTIRNILSFQPWTIKTEMKIHTYFYFFSLQFRWSVLCVSLLFMFDLAVVCLRILHFYLHRRQQCMSGWYMRIWYSVSFINL